MGNLRKRHTFAWTFKTNIMTKHRNYIQTVIISLLFCDVIISCITHWNCPRVSGEATKILSYLSIYIIGIYLFSCNRTRRMSEFFLILMAAAAVIYETYIGLGQLTGRRLSENNYFCCTGSFANPGPLGGFMALAGTLMLHVAIRRKRGWKILIPALMCVAIMLPVTLSRASWLAFLISGAAIAVTDARVRKWAWAHRMNGCRKWAVIVLAAIIASVSAFGAYRMKQVSADGRLLMCRMSVRAMMEKPLSGHGPGTYAKAYGDAQYGYFASGRFTEKQRLTADCPEYPFNTFLKVGVEYGIPAMIMLAVIILTAVTLAIRKDRTAGYGLLCLTVFAMFSYPQEIPVFRILAPLLTAGAAPWDNADDRPRSNRMKAIEWSIAGIAIFGPVYTGIRMGRKAKYEREWHRYEKYYTSKRYEKVAGLYSGISDELGSNHIFLFQYGQSLLESDRFEEADSVLQRGASMSCDPMFWNLMGRCRQAIGEYGEAEECFRHAYLMVPGRLYPLVLSAKLKYETGDTCGFATRLSEIRAFRPKLENALTSQLRSEIEELALKVTTTSESCHHSALHRQ